MGKHTQTNCRRIVWVCLTILWNWRLKGQRGALCSQNFTVTVTWILLNLTNPPWNLWRPGEFWITLFSRWRPTFFESFEGADFPGDYLAFTVICNIIFWFYLIFNFPALDWACLNFVFHIYIIISVSTKVPPNMHNILHHTSTIKIYLYVTVNAD